MRKGLLIGVTGASGIIYFRRLIEVLCNKYKNAYEEYSVIYTRQADIVSRYEIGYSIEELVRKHGACIKHVYGDTDWFSPYTSSSNTIGYDLVIVPASMDFIARVSNGLQTRLLERIFYNVARVGNNIVIVFRETPITKVDLENLLKITTQIPIVKLLPASPAFYIKPKTLDEIVDFIVGKILDLLQINHTLYNRWKSEEVI